MAENKFLDKINSPGDVKKLSVPQLEQLAKEIRQLLISVISHTGGHVAPNLGVVELTLALHKVFNTPEDKIIFDVGHQAYIHKIITGRREQFPTLRQYGGLSGFPKRSESEHDAFGTGHSSTSISAALGMACARDLQGEDYNVVAVIGDGSMTGGMAFEALNNAGMLHKKMIVVLNDNEMSISKNVGAMSEYLYQLRTGETYNKIKNDIEGWLKNMEFGSDVLKAIRRLKGSVKYLMVPTSIFEELGFTYLGPVDGHDLEGLLDVLQAAKKIDGPVMVHVLTKKGKGYAPAESNPGNYHGVSKFDLTGIPDPEVAPAESFSNAFGRTLSAAGNTDKTLCAITAAMKYGTGLQFFSHAHPERFFDVGMAEQHAVTFAAGLASKGMLPVVCIYSTFLQRSYDQIIHDVNLLHENVVFAVDRAGFVPEDGETHQGIYDPAFLSQTGMPIYSPSNYEELRHWLPILLSHEMQGPRAIRYPRGGESKALAKYGCSGKEYDKLIFTPGAKAALVSYADEVEDVLAAAEMLAKEGIPCDVYKLVRIFPFEEELIHDLSSYPVVLMAEECVACGGIGEHLARALQDAGWQGRYIHRAVRELCLPHATVPQIKQATGLDAAHLAEAVREADPKGEKTL